jgi:hypothetical protein
MDRQGWLRLMQLRVSSLDETARLAGRASLTPADRGVAGIAVPAAAMR